VSTTLEDYNKIMNKRQESSLRNIKQNLHNKLFDYDKINKINKIKKQDETKSFIGLGVSNGLVSHVMDQSMIRLNKFNMWITFWKFYNAKKQDLNAF